MPNQTIPQALVEGQRIEVRGEQFIVLNVQNLSDGQIIRVQGISELVRYQVLQLDTRLEASLKVVDARKKTLKADDSENYNKTRLAIETSWRYAAVASPVITLAGTAGIDMADYQRIPTEAALGLPQPRILLADGVGMGKTIQVGMLLAELMRRGRADRVLVIALKSILTQFQQELWQRFAIPLKRLDSQGIAEIKAEIPANKNPFDIFDKAIISIDTLKNDSQFKNKLDKARWDVIVIDECHVVANDGSQRGQLAERLAKQCTSLILTSATPHNGRIENFNNLINLLDPTVLGVEDKEIPLKEDLEHMVFRRFKHHILESKIKAHFQERVVEPLKAELAFNEQEVLEKQYELRMHERKKNNKGSDLFSITLFKSILSSPLAAVDTISKRILRHAAGADNQLNDNEELELLIEMQDLLNKMILAKQDTKFDVLVEKLKALKLNSRKEGERFVIFSERIKTLEYLQCSLRAIFNLSEEQVPMFHGTLSDTEQQELVEQFGQQDSPIKILLASDSGSQGVNLHYFCNHMFNYDLPWSIITLEQRNGRIDRYGQANTPHIYYLISDSKHKSKEMETDFRILDRLLAKEELVHKSLGDASSVLKLYDAAEESKLVTKAIVTGDPSLLDGEDDVDEEDPIAALFAALEANEETPIKVQNQPYQPPSLFYQPFDYYKVLTEMQDRKEVDIEVETSEQEITYRPVKNNDVASAGQQLAQRFRDALPAELFPTNSLVAFKLTTDKDRVQTSIKDARSSHNGKRLWAGLQPLYDLHPAVMMMVDKFKASINADEVPIARFGHRVADQWANKAYFVCRISQANKAGVSALDEHHVIQVELKDYSIAEATIPLQAWATAIKPRDIFRLAIQETELVALQELLPAVVDKVEQVWQQNLLPATIAHLQQLCQPRLDRLNTIISRLAHSVAAETIPLKRKPIQDRMAAMQKLKSESDQIVQLEDHPFIEVLAVWVQGANH